MLALLVICAMATSCLADDVEVMIRGLGRVRGESVDSINDKKINVFKGIPFAAPPVGYRRFKRPEPVEPWDGVIDAKEYGLSCVQARWIQFAEDGSIMQFPPEGKIGEDCLNLNIWAPANAVNAPVIVYIHGGTFVRGTNEWWLFDMQYLAAETNSIVITINYRIGFLGFLNLGVEEVPGNMGMLDQHMAIEWVHRYIRSFRGNPRKITLMGVSAGASSALLHALSPLPQYFDNIIANSPPPFTGFSYISPDISQYLSYYYAGIAGCNDTSDPVAFITCLYTLSVDDIIEKVPAPPNLVPTIDNYFLDADPTDKLSSLNISNDLNIMVGTNSEEGFFFILWDNTNLRLSPIRPPIPDQQVAPLLLNSIPSPGGANLDWVPYLIPLYRNLIPGIDNLGIVEASFSDVAFTCNVEAVASFFSLANNDVYVYRMQKMLANTPYPDWAGVPHSAEQAHVVGRPLDPALGYDQEDVKLSRKILKYFANFVRLGRPNKFPFRMENKFFKAMEEATNRLQESRENSALGRIRHWIQQNVFNSRREPKPWPKFKLPEKKYMTWDAPDLSVGTQLREQICVFWNYVAPAAMQGADVPQLLIQYGIVDASSFTCTGRCGDADTGVEYCSCDAACAAGGFTPCCPDYAALCAPP